MRVLITGSEGFVGWNLRRYLTEKGYEVVGLDLKEGAELKADVSSMKSLWSALKNIEIDAIIHLAAIANVPKTLEDPYTCYKINSFGTLNILEVAARKKVRRLIYASSANVYGVPLELPVREETPLNPRTPYDYSKVISEKLVESYHKHQGLPTVILRAWKLFGERDVPTTAIPRFITACLTGKPIELYNAGRDITDPTHILNYCHAVELSLKKEEAIGEVFNVGTGGKISIKDLAELIKKLTNSDSELKLLPPRTEAEKEPMKSYPSIEKIKKKLGYKPIITLKEGIKQTIEYYKRELKIE